MSKRLKLLLLASFMLLGAVGASQIAQAGSYGSLDDAKAAAAEQNKPLLIEFYTDW